MLTRSIKYYFDSFKGFRREVWFLALVTLINRAGTMVVPFMSLYLTKDLGFSLEDAGWVLTAFGAGSVVGSWLGGKLTDKLGFYPVMWGSLIGSAFFFIALQYLKTIGGICAGVFFLMCVADTLRPALFVAMRTYSRPENRTRAVTLIRLAINLGFSMGPAIGGVIISQLGYAGLFWVDGLSALAGGILFIMLLDKRDSDHNQESEINSSKEPHTDMPYMWFLLTGILISFAFVQHFSTIPLYYKEVYHLPEAEIGLLLGLNGFLIFVFEMPLIRFVERPAFSQIGVLAFSTVLFAASFLVLNLGHWIGLPIMGVVFMTVGEMLNFPFMNRFAMDRSAYGRSGAYMAMFAMIFSIAHILGHNTGMHLIHFFGYEVTWYIMTGVLLVAAWMFYFLKRMLRKEVHPSDLPEDPQ
ncbi:MAG: MFS transporter [Flavobacteriales bacterium]|nr:MFS transporter [Flavobacteriales bacterium]MCB9448099.1 MFS transporter [Flavobacteriales bacterium]